MPGLQGATGGAGMGGSPMGNMGKMAKPSPMTGMMAPASGAAAPYGKVTGGVDIFGGMPSPGPGLPGATWNGEPGGYQGPPPPAPPPTPFGGGTLPPPIANPGNPAMPGGPGGPGGPNVNKGGVPPTGPFGGFPPGGGPAGPQKAPTPPQAGGQTTFQDILNQQFGQDNPFGAAPGRDVVTPAEQQAQAWLDQNLAGLRERFAGSGIASNSARSALTQGATAGAAEAGLGTNLAQIAAQQRTSDLDRLMSGMLGAGQLSLGEQGIPLQYLNQLQNSGNTLLGFEQLEQQSPLLQAILPFLTNFGPQQITGWQG